MLVQPYLFFEGRCDEALEFYRKALKAEITAVMRYKESPDQSGVEPGMADKVMHSAFQVGETTVMASDGMNSGKPNFAGVMLSLTVGSDDEAQRIFNALSEGGQVRQPLTKTFFSSKFGMLADRFGVGWMVLTSH